MKKRILLAAMHHESNSFNPITAGEKDFRVRIGQDMIQDLPHNNSVRGIAETLQAADCELVPTRSVSAVPNGEVDKDFYLQQKAAILEQAAAAKDQGIDGLCLALHGSMRVRDFGEAEGPFLEELRQLFPDKPIYCALDTHTTMTARMVNHADGFVAYKCAPHTDQYETGAHAARLLLHALAGKSSYHAWVKVPLLIAGEKSSTLVDPMQSLIAHLKERESQPGILASSYLMGFPWSDNDQSGAGVYVLAEDQDQANEEALYLADLLWQTREKFDFQTETYPSQEALDVAFEALAQGQAGPIYISDSGDNPTAGSSSDVTGLLSLLLADPRTAQLPEPALFAGIYDPVATKSLEGRVGEELELSFGAAFDHKTSQALTCKGKLMAYIPKWTGFGHPSDVALFRTGNVDIVLAEKHIGYTGTGLFFDLGRDPRKACLVIVKLGYLTPEHSEIASRSIMALSQGSTNEDLVTLPYRHVPRPIYPLDPDMTYQVKEQLQN
ncbi:MAG: M81 family metallopeptidase [Eubacteriales bacterium]|nr:M81 family metallopeptidase [Eubacteriales bacterium]